MVDLYPIFKKKMSYIHAEGKLSKYLHTLCYSKCSVDTNVIHISVISCSAICRHGCEVGQIHIIIPICQPNIGEVVGNMIAGKQNENETRVANTNTLDKFPVHRPFHLETIVKL